MNCRHTIQMDLVLNAGNKLQSHATAAEIYDEIVRAHPSISLRTACCNLNRLSQMGEIQKVEIPGGTDHFDHRCDDHYHRKCEIRGKLCDLDMGYKPGLEKNIGKTNGFYWPITMYYSRASALCP